MGHLTRLQEVDGSEQTREELFMFARNFAAEADRQQAEIERLQALIAEGVKEYIKLCPERLKRTPQQWAEAEVKWQKVVQWAEQLAAEAKE